jgi:hypothetical protein
LSTTIHTPPRARAEAREAPEAAIETVDPDRARWWLAANEKNRDLRLPHAEELTRAMRRGEWGISPDAIAFDTEGRLINGQHRLVAVARSGVAADFIIVRGLTPTAQERTDTGAKRHLADMLSLRGVPDAKAVAAVTGYVWKYLRYGTLVPPVVPATVQELIATYERHPEISESNRHVKPLAKKGPITPGVTSALHYLFSRVEPEDADTFVERLALGIELSEGDAILVLRRMLERARARSSATYNPSAYAKAAWTIKAWNAWQEGRPVQSLAWKSGGGSPEPFPQITGLAAEDIDPVLATMPEGPTPAGAAERGIADLLAGRDD